MDRLIIFDCDGVLVDSETIVNNTFVKLLSENDVYIEQEESLKLFTGLNAKSVYELISNKYQKTFNDDEINHIQSEIQRELSIYVQPILGILELLIKLKNMAAPTCIASSGTFERITGSLRTARLIPFFNKDQIFSSVMVTKGKPAPDLFLFTANQMGYNPKDCLVIEDSVVVCMVERVVGRLKVIKIRLNTALQLLAVLLKLRKFDG